MWSAVVFENRPCSFCGAIATSEDHYDHRGNCRKRTPGGEWCVVTVFNDLRMFVCHLPWLEQDEADMGEPYCMKRDTAVRAMKAWSGDRVMTREQYERHCTARDIRIEEMNAAVEYGGR